MNKPKTKKEALAKLEKASSELEELKAYIDTMPDDVDRDLTDIKENDEYYFIDFNNSISFGVASVNRDETNKDFPLTLRTRSKEHLESMKKYRDATSRFMAKCHEVNIGDDGGKYHMVYFNSSIKEWRCGLYFVETYNPLVIMVSKEGAKKLIAWCEREYPNGLDWSEL